MADPFVAEIRIFPFNFAPTGWALCNGQVLPLSQNTALFSLLGTTYGGDGKSNFALPNLQGRAPMHPGQGPGLSLHDLGETGGSDTVTLLESEIPSHSHAVSMSVRPGRQSEPPRPRSRNRQRGLCRAGESGKHGFADPRPRRWQPAPQQPDALPHPQLLYRAPGGVSAERVGRRSGTIKTTTRYLPLI